MPTSFDLERLSLVKNYMQQFAELKLSPHFRLMCFLLLIHLLSNCLVFLIQLSCFVFHLLMNIIKGGFITYRPIYLLFMTDNNKRDDVSNIAQNDPPPTGLNK